MVVHGHPLRDAWAVGKVDATGATFFLENQATAINNLTGPNDHCIQPMTLNRYGHDKPVGRVLMRVMRCIWDN